MFPRQWYRRDADNSHLTSADYWFSCCNSAEPVKLSRVQSRLNCVDRRNDQTDSPSPCELARRDDTELHSDRVRRLDRFAEVLRPRRLMGLRRRRVEQGDRGGGGAVALLAILFCRYERQGETDFEEPEALKFEASGDRTSLAWPSSIFRSKECSLSVPL
jgi:hypothetical protein